MSSGRSVIREMQRHVDAISEVVVGRTIELEHKWPIPPKSTLNRTDTSKNRQLKKTDAPFLRSVVHQRFTKFTSILICTGPRRTSSLVSPAAAAGACTCKPRVFKRSAACRTASLMRTNASSRGSVWSVKTRSRSTDRRGMSRTKRLIAVPPFSANVSSTNTSGATCVSRRAVSR